MNRRSLLVAAGAVGVTTAVGGAAVAVAADPDAERRLRPLLTWELVGGFVPAGWTALRAPRLVAYDDGVVIADAAKRLKVSGGDLRSLRNHATTVLRDPANARRRPDAPIIADVPSTVFTARTGGRKFTQTYEGLEETRRDRAYPAATYALLDHLTLVRARALRDGTAWKPDAVRAIAILMEPAQPTAGGNPGPARTPVPAWPSGVPVPHFGRDEWVARMDLRNADARALVHAVPNPDPGQWPVFRLPNGRQAQLNWRRLLPHE
jgi:hypothetical protein